MGATVNGGRVLICDPGCPRELIRDILPQADVGTVADAGPGTVALLVSPEAPVTRRRHRPRARPRDHRDRERRHRPHRPGRRGRARHRRRDRARLLHRGGVRPRPGDDPGAAARPRRRRPVGAGGTLGLDGGGGARPPAGDAHRRRRDGPDRPPPGREGRGARHGRAPPRPVRARRRRARRAARVGRRRLAAPAAHRRDARPDRRPPPGPDAAGDDPREHGPRPDLRPRGGEGGHARAGGVRQRLGEAAARPTCSASTTSPSRPTSPGTRPRAWTSSTCARPAPWPPRSPSALACRAGCGR